MFQDVFSALLADKKISKAKFAEEIGVARQTVYSWLAGSFFPDKKTEEKIADYFGVSIDYLRGIQDGWIKIPVLGEVPAGDPTEAHEHAVDYFSIPAEMKKQMDFGLIVKGSSMIGAGILDKDVVFVKRQPVAENRQIIVARLDGDTTVKRFFKTDHSIILRPENPDFDPILIGPNFTGEFVISGIVTGLWRQMF